MTILDKIEYLWTPQMQQQVGKWAKTLKDNEEKISDAAKAFHEWDPLRVYLSVTRAMKPKISFSLRYQGQEVANLIVDKKGNVELETSNNNNKYFKNIPGGGMQQKFNWRSVQAKAFRKYFKKPSFCQDLKSPEHMIESEFLKQMAHSTSGKFAGTLKNIQPVLLAGCPFQFPLPISGNKGEPKIGKGNKPGKGNIDILARRGTGKGTRISIWELKKPNSRDHAIEQAYIYAVTLIKMLRSPQSGAIWYNNIIGFKGNIPNSLTIESVVAVSIDKRNHTAFESKMRNFKEANSLTVGNDNIKLCVAYYEYENGSRNPLSLPQDIKEI